MIAGHLAVSIGMHERESEDTSAPSARPLHGRGSARPGRTVTFHASDGSVFLDGEYVIKGVAGRMLFSMLVEHDSSGRSHFSNRELRMNPDIDLPAGNDNRGQLRLLVDADLELRQVERRDPKVTP